MAKDLLWGKSLLRLHHEKLLDEIPGLGRELLQDDLVQHVVGRPSFLLVEGRNAGQHLVQDDALQVQVGGGDRERDYQSPARVRDLHKDTTINYVGAKFTVQSTDPNKTIS